MAQSEEARHSLFYRPAAFDVLAPELLDLYSRRLDSEALQLVSPRQRKQPAAAAAAAAAAAEEPAAASPRSPQAATQEEEQQQQQQLEGGLPEPDLDFGFPAGVAAKWCYCLSVARGMVGAHGTRSISLM